MQRSTLVGIKVGLLAVLIIVGLLGMTTNAPVTEWLQEAFLGIAFTFAFGLGAPTALAYFLSSLVFVLVFGAGYYIGKKASSRLDG